MGLVVLLGYPLVIFAATVFVGRLLQRDGLRVVSYLVIVAVPPIAIAVFMFPPGSGAGYGFGMLIPLFWVLGVAGVTAGDLVVRREIV